MILRFPIFLILSVLAWPVPAIASDSVEAAGTCLTDATSGRDRKDLVTWIYLAIAKHPEIRTHSAATPAAEEASNARVGALFTRLIADDCPAQIRAMVAEHGPGALERAFEVLGRVAMTELMGHPDVNGAFSGLARHADQARIEAVLAGAK